MCQKAVGGLFAPLVEAFEVIWTRGERSIFHSSHTNWRGFCKACGTPLTYEYKDFIEITIGTLDNPNDAMPEVQVNARYRTHCFDGLTNLPTKTDEEQLADEGWNTSVVSKQHPDHDT